MVRRLRQDHRDPERAIAEAVRSGARGRLEHVGDEVRERRGGVVGVEGRAPDEARLAGRLGDSRQRRRLVDRDDREDAAREEDRRDRLRARSAPNESRSRPGPRRRPRGGARRATAIAPFVADDEADRARVERSGAPRARAERAREVLPGELRRAHLGERRRVGAEREHPSEPDHVRRARGAGLGVDGAAGVGRRDLDADVSLALAVPRGVAVGHGAVAVRRARGDRARGDRRAGRDHERPRFALALARADASPSAPPERGAGGAREDHPRAESPAGRRGRSARRRRRRRATLRERGERGGDRGPRERDWRRDRIGRGARRARGDERCLARAARRTSSVDRREEILHRVEPRGGRLRQRADDGGGDRSGEARDDRVRRGRIVGEDLERTATAPSPPSTAARR